MSRVQQTCPRCPWARAVELPQTANPAHDDTVAKHVARSLQWEWLAHWEDEHEDPDTAEYVLISVAFADWVKQEGDQPAKQETPPGKGEGETVGVNLPVITPEQAKQLAEAVEHAMVSVADSIQRFAEHAVPAIHAAQQTLTQGLRRIVEQRPQFGCACNGGEGDHQPGGVNCLFQADRPMDAATARVLRDAATLAPGARGPQFWRHVYGDVPKTDDVPTCNCTGAAPGHAPGAPGCVLEPDGTDKP